MRPMPPCTRPRTTTRASRTRFAWLRTTARARGPLSCAEANERAQPAGARSDGRPGGLVHARRPSPTVQNRPGTQERRPGHDQRPSGHDQRPSGHCRRPSRPCQSRSGTHGRPSGQDERSSGRGERRSGHDQNGSGSWKCRDPLNSRRTRKAPIRFPFMSGWLVFGGRGNGLAGRGRLAFLSHCPLPNPHCPFPITRSASPPHHP